MYTYVTEFNLAVRGDATDEYILDSVRTGPELWGNIKGVTGTLLLSNAFALGGEFEYQFRVDITSLGTLARIDETVKAGEGGWRKSREIGTGTARPCVHTSPGTRRETSSTTRAQRNGWGGPRCHQCGVPRF